MSMFVTLLACSAGLISGLIAAQLSIACWRRLGNGGFWRQCAGVGQLLLSAEDEGQLIREYLRLWPALFAFLAKQLAVAAVAIAPVVIAYSGLSPLAALENGDWELGFFASVSLASVVGLLVARRA
jgi:hypothetical protein